MVIVYILAVVGGIFVLGLLALIVMIVIVAAEPEDEEKTVCALTGEHCMYTSQQGKCNSCPEADKFLRNQRTNG